MGFNQGFSYEDTKWYPLPLQNGWQNYENLPDTGFCIARCRKDRNNLVLVQGLVKFGSGIVTVVATLPRGYRPKQKLVWAEETDPNANGRVTAEPDGTLLMESGSTAWISINFVFPAEW